MRLNTISITLTSCVIPLALVVAQHGAGDAGLGPFSGPEVQFKEDSPETPNQKG